MKTIKITVVGDKCVGKTSLLLTFKSNISLELLPSTLPTWTQEIVIDDEKLTLKFHDTSSHSHDSVRLLDYTQVWL